jgi:hypothetical protein
MKTTNYDPACFYPAYGDNGGTPCAEHWEKWIDEQDADPRCDGVQHHVMIVSRKTVRAMLERVPEAFVSLPPYTEEELKAQRIANGYSE